MTAITTYRNRYRRQNSINVAPSSRKQVIAWARWLNRQSWNRICGDDWTGEDCDAVEEREREGREELIAHFIPMRWRALARNTWRLPAECGEGGTSPRMRT